MERKRYPDRIVYHYTTQANGDLQYAHGVWGGLNPHGEIEISFYHESDLPPEQAVQQIGPDGLPGAELPQIDEDCARHIERRIHTRILMSYDTARALQDWLDERISELDSEAASEMYDPNNGIQQ